MGKEWLYWVGGGGGGRNGSSSTKRGRPPPREMKAAAASASTGCMCAVFHLFHLNHFPSAQQNNHSYTYPFLQEEATITSRGVEAPRNSLELEETAAMKPEQKLNFPVVIEIKTSKSKSRLDEISSECSSCNSPKTPSVVARLMGLDLLPQCPSISSKSHRSFSDYDIAGGARSLPETPRISSSSSSRRSDVERHRLSLQIIKENIVNQDENRSPNINRNTDQCRRDENLVLIKPAKNRNIKISSNDGKQSNVTNKSSRISSSYDSSHQTPLVQQQKQKHSKKVSDGGNCSSSRLKKLSRRDADTNEFVRSRETHKINLMENKSKRRIPLSCDNILQVKKGPTPPPTKLPQNKSQVSDALSSKSNIQLSKKPSQSYNQQQLQRNKILTPPPCSTNGGATALRGGSQRTYIHTILKHAGIINPLTKWNSPSHPIDPGIFHHHELNAAAAVVSPRCNRKLIDELLAKSLTARFSNRRRCPPDGDGGCFPSLCKTIESFPAAKCVVLEDIDSLIDRDMCESRSNGYFDEEEKIVCEIEGEIVEWLVGEAVAVIGGDAAEYHIYRRGEMPMVD